MSKPKYDLAELREKCSPDKIHCSIGVRQLAFVFAQYDAEKSRAEKAEAENARLRERLESALDKIADIQENGEEEGACHACGICAGCPEDWQPTDDHNCRVMLELWADGEPLPWEEAARRAVAESEVKG